MASVRKYATAKGARWRVQYRSPDGRSRTKRGFETKAKAQAWADKNAVSIHDQDWIDPADSKATVGHYQVAWDSNLQHLKPKTAHDQRAIWRNHVSPQWKHRQVGSIKPSEVQAWLNGIDKSASLVRQAHACLAQILDLAMADRAIRTNPARGVKLPRKDGAVKVYLTAEQLGQLAGACTRNGELVWLLGTVGLRWGEAAALRVKDVNALRRRISVERNAVTVGTKVVIGTPKTHERRTVVVPTSVVKLLEEKMAGKSADDLLWPRRDGSPMRPPSHGDWYYTALDKCMDADSNFPRVTPHGLRHVAAGLMVSAGANVKLVQRQLGHSSAAMTLDVYAELWDEDLEAVGAAVDEKISGVVRLSSKRA